MRRAKLEVLTIALAYIIIYAPSLAYPFLNIDDDYVITRNPYILGEPAPMGAPAVPALGRSSPALAAFAEPKRFWMGSEYLPLATLSLLVDGRLWGPAPWAFRGMSLLLSLIAALLFHQVLRRLLHARAGEACPAAFLAGFWFAIHPLHVEAAAWPAMRKDVLTAVFAFAAFLAFLRWRSKDKGRDLALASALYACALLSKATAIFLAPVFLIAAMLWPRRARAKEALFWLPFGLISVADFIAVYAVGRSEGIVSAAPPPLARVLMTDLTIALRYLRLSLWPDELCSLYFWPDTTGLTAELALALLVALIGIGAALALYRRAPRVCFAIGFALLALVPVLNLFPKSTRIADRYAYFFSAGLALLFALGLHALAELRGGRYRRLVAGLAAAAILLFAARSAVRIRDFDGAERHCRSILACSYPAPHTYTSLGGALRAKGQLQESIAAYEAGKRAMNVANFSAGARIELRMAAGAVRVQAGELEGALAEYRWILERHPQHPGARQNFAVVRGLIARRDG